MRDVWEVGVWKVMCDEGFELMVGEILGLFEIGGDMKVDERIGGYEGVIMGFDEEGFEGDRVWGYGRVGEWGLSGEVWGEVVDEMGSKLEDGDMGGCVKGVDKGG